MVHRITGTAHRVLFGTLLGRLGSTCPACGRRSLHRRRRILWEELVKSWELSPQWAEWFERREGVSCACCGSSLRCQHLAATIVAQSRARWAVEAGDFAGLCAAPGFHRLRVAEINAAGHLHQFLRRHPQLAYSEYDSSTPGVRAEDLAHLSYPDESFDLIVTSETLEHVLDLDTVLGEIHRVLVPGGLHIFTVPVVWERPVTRVRARTVDGEIRHLLAPSYHGRADATSADLLVTHEFGADLPNILRARGFEVDCVRSPDNPAVATMVTKKPFDVFESC